ncbi:MAG TPA: aspartyl protease family protein [Pyrinomonadaceae bacterium]|nr:aspartyl protease family protein [Pyrinomonadaceae bacterium]
MIRKSRFALLIFVALLSTFSAIGTGARHNFQAATASTNAPITIPFELVTRHIMLKVRINNSRPLSFVFDTGDKVCVVDTEVAKELGLKMEGQLRIGGAGADTLPASFIKEATWSLAGLDGFTQPVALTMPLGRMAARFGQDFDGIIGSDFIKNFVVEVDYQNRVLKLHDKDKFNYAGPGESIPIQLNSQGHPILEGEVTPLNGDAIKGKFVLDLGAGGSLALLSPVVTQHNLLGNGLKTIKAIGVGGAGGQSTGQIGRVKSLQVGKFAIANPITLFSEDKAGAMANRALVGNIGQMIASKFKVYLDYGHSRIILEPTPKFADPMDRATSGLALTTEGKDYATVRVSDVLENSPASEAGLQKDDIVLSIDGKTASELKVTGLGEMFERPATYKLTIRRGEQTLQVPLTPRKLI